MIIMNTTELLRTLCNAFGPSGCEDAVRDIIKEQISDICSDIKIDRLGNLIAHLSFGEGEKKKLMLSAHMDEVGFMVNEITDEGYLKFSTVGGISGAVLSGRRVVVGDEKTQANGIIASKAVHQKSKKEREEIPDVEKLLIDIGVDKDEEAKKFVSVGTFGTFAPNFSTFGKNNRMLSSKALDDRFGCAILIEVMRDLVKNPPKNLSLDLYFCFTVREEVGLSGARVAAQTICPDYAIVLETTAIADIPDVPESSRVAQVGDGGVVSLMDRSTIYSREMINIALETAKACDIAAQVKKYVSGGNDAGQIHKAGAGTKTLALSAPTRYLHSPVCVASLDDYEAMRALVLKMITSERFC